jgi:hypothetical protein
MHNVCASRHEASLRPGSILRVSQSWKLYGVEVADVEAASGGTIDGAASIMTVLVLVEVRPFWLVAT